MIIVEVTDVSRIEGQDLGDSLAPGGIENHFLARIRAPGIGCGGGRSMTSQGVNCGIFFLHVRLMMWMRLDDLDKVEMIDGTLQKFREKKEENAMTCR